MITPLVGNVILMSTYNISYVSEISFIFGLYNKDTSIAEQQILLETKYYILFCKYSKASLNLKALKRRLILVYDTTKKAAVFENSLENFFQTWAQYNELT